MSSIQLACFLKSNEFRVRPSCLGMSDTPLVGPELSTLSELLEAPEYANSVLVRIGTVVATCLEVSVGMCLNEVHGAEWSDGGV